MAKDLHSAAGKIDAPIKLGKLITVIESRIENQIGKNYKINLVCKNWIANQLSGMLFRYSDHTDIFYSAHLNVCWSRLVVCKELSHLILDSGDRHFTRDPVALVQGLVTQVVSIKPEYDLISENVAMYSAIELLLPWHLRDDMISMMKSGKSDYDIAVALRAPENIVNLMLKSNYGKLSSIANSATTPPAC